MLTERMQRQAILDLVKLRPGPNVQPEMFGEPWRSIYLTTAMYLGKNWEPMEALGYAATVGLRALHGDHMPQGAAYDQAYSDLLTAIERSTAHSYTPKTLRQTAAQRPPVAWLWPGWLPKSMLSLLAARPGAGKTHSMLDLVRCLQHGSEWPDGAPGEQGDTVWVEGEGISQEIMERAVALGIDPDRMWMVEANDGEMLDLTSGVWRDEVIETVAAVKPKLIVVDSLSTISPNGQDRSEQVAPLLVWLVGLARWSSASVVLVHHLRKQSSGQASFPIVTMDDIRGSGNLVAQSRSVFVVNVMGYGLSAPRRLEVLKKTISRGADPKPLEAQGIKDESGMIRRFEYGEAAAVDGPTTRQDCGEWLVDLLADGPMKLKDIAEAGKEMEFGTSMIWRARKSLQGQIVDTKGRQNPQNKWALATWSEAEGLDTAAAGYSSDDDEEI